jgi:hypothetical protein
MNLDDPQKQPFTGPVLPSKPDNAALLVPGTVFNDLFVTPPATQPKALAAVGREIHSS